MTEQVAATSQVLLGEDLPISLQERVYSSPALRPVLEHADRIGVLAWTAFCGAATAVANLEYGEEAALLAASTEMLKCFGLGFVATQVGRKFTDLTSDSPRLVQVALSVGMPTAVAVGGTAAVHALAGTQNPWVAIAAVSLTSPPTFWALSQNRRKVSDSVLQS